MELLNAEEHSYESLFGRRNPALPEKVSMGALFTVQAFLIILSQW
jgi:hypothetical protein